MDTTKCFYGLARTKVLCTSKVSHGKTNHLWSVINSPYNLGVTIEPTLIAKVEVMNFNSDASFKVCPVSAIFGLRYVIFSYCDSLIQPRDMQNR